MTSYSFGRVTICCRKLSAITSLTVILFPVLGLVNSHQGPAPISVAPYNSAASSYPPVSEGALGEFHDVSLVHQGDRTSVVIDCILQRLAHQSAGALGRYRLYANPRGPGKTDAGNIHFFSQELNHLFSLGASGTPIQCPRRCPRYFHGKIVILVSSGRFNGVSIPLK